MKNIILNLLVVSFCLIACSTCKYFDSSKGFSQLSSSKTGISFVNKVADQEKFNALTYRNFYNGGGVAIGDINNDGLKDVYFTANMGKNKLYLNKGNFSFEDISNTANIEGTKDWSTGVTMADVNQDGWLDIYVCNSGDIKNMNRENELYINQKNNTFKEEAKLYGLADLGMSTHATFFDYDLDGDLDCYVLNNSYMDPERISLFRKERENEDLEGGDRLYKNENGKFINVTKQAGIFSSNIGFGLGISVGDLNNDSYPDIYISNDFWERDYLYINQKNGTYKEQLTESMSYTSVSSMGSDMADINNDGNLDIFTTDMLPPDNYRLKAATKFDDYYHEDLKFKNSYFHQFVQNCLQINRGDGTFRESAFMAGVSATDWSWGALIFDMNLDSKKDIFVSNGVYHDITDADFTDFISDPNQIKKLVEEKGRYDFRDFIQFLPNNKRKNYAFVNQGKSQFANNAQAMGLDEASFSNGAAYGDLDNDGDYDLIVNNVNMESFVYQNNAVEEKKNFVKFKFKGSSLNKNGIGTTVIVETDSMVQKNHVMASRGFQSSVDTDLIFGLTGQNVKKVTVIWPDGKKESLSQVKANQTITLNYENATLSNEILNEESKKFQEMSNQIGLGISHIENIHSDFDQERLAPHMLSNLGPKMIVGDVNGDKTNDIIYLAAFGNTTRLFLNTNKSFIEKKVADFISDNNFEGISGELFDVDGDKDLDLLIGAGGNQNTKPKESYELRYYTNDGAGNFKKMLIPGVKVEGQIACIKPFDYDKDGDMDVFLGGRAIPGVYGLTPRSFLLNNNGLGLWQDVTTENTGPIGLVSDAAWADINADGWADLVVVGHWMPITVFVNGGGDFNSSGQLANSSGWWNTLKPADLDSDGDTDFIVGNWGLNQKLNATIEKPLSIYIANFDGKEAPTALLEWYAPEEEKPYPFASRQDLYAQIPLLKKTSFKYQEYAKKQITDLFKEEIMKTAQKKSIQNFNTSYLINNNGNLELKSMPAEAQYSSVFAIEYADIDADGAKDIFLGGNMYKLKPEMGRIDGFDGGYFKGTKSGEFNYISSTKSGLKVNYEVRDAKWIDNKLFIARNNYSNLIFGQK